MAVRPVDSLTMLPRLDQAGRMVHQHDQQPYAFQQLLGQQVQAKAERERTQVKQKPQAEQSGIQNREQRNRGGGGRGQSQAGERRPAPAEPAARPSATGNGRLDVKV